MSGRDEFEFANDIRTALEERSPRTAWMLILAIVLVTAAGIAWAKWAVVEEVTTGSGRVIPSTQLQVMQTLEGGIIREILMKEGDLVDQGQVLMRIDDTGFASRLGELMQRQWTLRAEIARREAEAGGGEEIVADEELVREAPDSFRSESEVFKARRAKMDDELAILRQQLVQKRQELKELQAREQKLALSLEPLSRELELTTKLKAQRVVPEVELLRLQRQHAELSGDLEIVKASVPRAESAITEAEARMLNAVTTFKSEARERLVAARGELAVVVESVKAARDRVVRTALRAPVRGVVNKLNVTTIGAVVQPGQQLIEIVPLDDTLLIEAQVRPQDVAFIRPDLDASVKLTAYDYSIFGSLPGKVERISADTITDERGESFYRVIVRTERNYLTANDKKLPIIPGMVATVDVLTGEKTVLDYLLKPVTRVRKEALRER